jgi:hypothetical protein
MGGPPNNQRRVAGFPTPAKSPRVPFRNTQRSREVATAGVTSPCRLLSSGVLSPELFFRSRFHRWFAEGNILRDKCKHPVRRKVPAVRRRHKTSPRKPSRDGLPGSRPKHYCFNCFSIAATTSFESGVTSGSKRCTTFPLRSTRNLVKFHLISPRIPAAVSAVR